MNPWPITTTAASTFGVVGSHPGAIFAQAGEQALSGGLAAGVLAGGSWQRLGWLAAVLLRGCLASRVSPGLARPRLGRVRDRRDAEVSRSGPGRSHNAPVTARPAAGAGWDGRDHRDWGDG